MSRDADRNGAGLPLLPVKALVESLLFVSHEPVTAAKLAVVLEASPDEIEEVLSQLAVEYQPRGFRLQRIGQSVQIVSAPEAADTVRRFLGIETSSKLSAAALETLAIIAYRQPATRSQIQAVRGVDSDSVLRTLLNQGLIEEQGRLERAGRPILYGTSFAFLQHFGLSDLGQLPPLEGNAQASAGDVEGGTPS